MRLRDGGEVEDPRLDRLVQFDERSRSFGVRETLEQTYPRSYTWRCDTYLDQGAEGACVGHAWAHDHAARPYVRPADSALAFALYYEAQKLDPWPGEAYSGTSVLAGAKAAMARGHLSEYRWAFNLTDALTAISRKGPAILGVNWYSGMFNTDAQGYLRVSGYVMGGHAILARGVSVPGRYVTLHNSWGPEWGQGGRARITWDDLGRLLDEDGEVCVPLKRGL